MAMTFFSAATIFKYESPNHAFEWGRAYCLPIITAFIFLSNASLAASVDWREYTLANHGFSITLPSIPQSRQIAAASGDGLTHIYESFKPPKKLTKFSIFITLPENHGIFEPASMDVFLDGYIKSIAHGGQIQISRRTTFRGLPALEYQINHVIGEQPYVLRGVALMVDGGHMRLSMLHPSNDQTAITDFERFLGSFKLIPIAYQGSKKPFRDQRGITFIPPDGWIQKPVKNTMQIAHYSNLTRSIYVMAAGNSAYSCSNFHADMQRSGRLNNVSSATLSGRQYSKFISHEDVPKYNVRVTTVQYCLNSSLGAVVISGSEEESMFPRWAAVFEGAAGTLRIQ